MMLRTIDVVAFRSLLERLVMRLEQQRSPMILVRLAKWSRGS